MGRSAGGELKLETFILPLLDSQIYNQFRALLPPNEAASPLRVRPDPVLLLSLNLTEDTWVKLSGTLGAIGGGATGIDPSLFDLFGPGVHLAVQDGDPIITLGNADLDAADAGLRPLRRRGASRRGDAARGGRAAHPLPLDLEGAVGREAGYPGGPSPYHPGTAARRCWHPAPTLPRNCWSRWKSTATRATIKRWPT